MLDPSEERLLLERGIGITNMVPRTTAAAAELTQAEIRAGGARLAAMVARHRIRTVAILGDGRVPHRVRPTARRDGLQPEPLAGAAVWVVPNPSGLQARYGVEEIGALLREAWATSVTPGTVSPPSGSA